MAEFKTKTGAGYIAQKPEYMPCVCEVLVSILALHQAQSPVRNGPHK